MFKGFVLAIAMACSQNSYDCKYEVVDKQIYDSKSACEWELNKKSSYYRDLVCIPVNVID